MTKIGVSCQLLLPARAPIAATNTSMPAGNLQPKQDLHKPPDLGDREKAGALTIFQALIVAIMDISLRIAFNPVSIATRCNQ